MISSFRVDLANLHKR